MSDIVDWHMYLILFIAVIVFIGIVLFLERAKNNRKIPCPSGIRIIFLYILIVMPSLIFLIIMMTCCLTQRSAACPEIFFITISIKINPYRFPPSL